MPKITINEIDLTTSGSLNATSNVVYVPGLALKIPTGYDSNPSPRLYSDLTRFEADFGDKVPLIKEANGSTNLIYDTGFIYATELLRLGMPVLFDCLVGRDRNATGEKITLEYVTQNSLNPGHVKKALSNALSNNVLKDKGLYNIKFITSGGYVDQNIATLALDLAATRMDCCALVDVDKAKKASDITTTLSATTKLLEDLGLPALSNTNDKLKYCAAFAPHGDYSVPCIRNYLTGRTNSDGTAEKYPSTVNMPASFGYLLAAANSFNKGVNNWAAIAGAVRGAVPYLEKLDEYYTEDFINNTLQQRTSGVSINPIARINPFGDIIWGNRTLFDNTLNGGLTASSFLNIRNLISDVKKILFKACKQLTFEQNSAILWIKLTSIVKPTLDQMVSGSGLSGYELIKKVAKEKAKLAATVRLFAIEAVEDFEIDIVLADDTAITE